MSLHCLKTAAILVTSGSALHIGNKGWARLHQHQHQEGCQSHGRRKGNSDIFMSIVLTQCLHRVYCTEFLIPLREQYCHTAMVMH